jgi:uncharacterized protein YbjT (DUF2867 family)
MEAQRVLVVGASGALGRPVVLALRERGVAVRALCRHPAAAQDLAAIGAEVVAGDLVEPTTIERALAGCTRVLAAAHGLLGRGRHRSEAVDDAGHRQLITLARAAAVERFVYTSGYGVSAAHPVDFFRTKFAIEAALRGSGLDAVVLRPTAFMEQHVHAFNGAGLLATGRARLIGAGAKTRNFVAAGDVARFAVRALLEDPPPARTIEIGGPDNASNLDVAALYARVAGLPLKTSHLPLALARLMAAVAAPVHPGVARVLRLATLGDAEMPERFDGAATLQRDFGIRLTTLETFVRERVSQAQPARAPA